MLTQPPRSLWRNRDFMLLRNGQAVSTLGSAMSGLALPLLVLALTRSPAQSGLIAALGDVPYLVFSLPAGALIDRWDRKRVMIYCDVAASWLTARSPSPTRWATWRCSNSTPWRWSAARLLSSSISPRWPCLEGC